MGANCDYLLYTELLEFLVILLNQSLKQPHLTEHIYLVPAAFFIATQDSEGNSGCVKHINKASCHFLPVLVVRAQTPNIQKIFIARSIHLRAVSPGSPVTSEQLQRIPVAVNRPEEVCHPRREAALC